MIYLRYIFLIISLSSLSQVQNLNEVVVSAQIINSLYTPLSLSKIKRNPTQLFDPTVKLPSNIKLKRNIISFASITLGGIPFFVF